MTFDRDWAFRVYLKKYPLTPNELAYHFGLMAGTMRVHPPIANDLELVALMDDTTQAVYAAYVRGGR